MITTLPSYYKISQEDFESAKSTDKIEILCQNCATYFTTSKKNILCGLRKRNTFIQSCSAKCSSNIKATSNRQEISCKQCNKTIYKTKTDSLKSENHFCSRSCSATYNNKIFIKKPLTRVCSECTEKVFTYRHTRCEQHNKEYQESKYINRTMGEYRNLLSVKGKHISWINSHIRLFAKSWNKDLRQLPCAKCNYDKHVELAHIKGISTYSDDTLLVVINNKTNLIQLCPNCHWEFDNGYREGFKQLLKDLNKDYSEK